MPANFVDRLRAYYLDVAKVLRGEADSARIFPNPTDKGGSRERVYIDFLRQHAPSKCNVFSGGFLFDDDGAESKQLDVIVTTDTAPRFNLHNDGDFGKSFSPVEGRLGVVSVKSQLNKQEIFDALSGIGSIPPTKSLSGRVNPMLSIKDYDSWPLKVVYATDGIAWKTLLGHIADFYSMYPTIPLSRRPEFIHVLGKYLLVRKNQDLVLRKMPSGDVLEMPDDLYFAIEENPDLHGIVRVLHKLQLNATLSSQISFEYLSLFNNVAGPMVLNQRSNELAAHNFGGSVLVMPPTAME